MSVREDELPGAEAATAARHPGGAVAQGSGSPRWRFWPLVAMALTAAALVGFWVASQTHTIRFGYFRSPPVYGERIPVWDDLALTVIPAGVLLAGIGWMVTSWRRLPAWLALGLVVLAGALTATAVNLVRGHLGDLTRGVSTAPTSPYYTSDLHFLYELGPRRFVERHAELSPQFHSASTKTHPAGVMIFLYLLFRVIGASHSFRIAAVIAVVAFCSAVSAWLIARTLAGERAGRIAAVLFAAAPAPLMLAYSNLDTVFAVPLSLGAALLVLAADRRSWRLAAAGGAVLGVATTMTLATSFIVFATAVALLVQTGWRTAPRLLAAAAAGGLAVLGLARLVLGLDILEAYQAPPKIDHPYDWYWILGSPAAWLIYAGLPLAALGVYGVFRRVPGARRPVLVPVLVLVMVVWAGLPAQVTKLRPGEVERTWMFLYPMVAATAGVVVDRWTAGFRRRWLRGGAVAGLVLLSVGQAVLIQGLYENFY